MIIQHKLFGIVKVFISSFCFIYYLLNVFHTMIKKVLTIASAIALCGTFISKADSINYGLAADGGVSFEGAKRKQGNVTLGGEMTYNWNPNLFFGMDFGDEGEEVVGFEISAGFGGRKFAIKPAALNDAEKAAKIEAKSPFEVGLMGVTFGITSKFMFARFDGGCLVAKLGVDGGYAVIKDIKTLGIAPTGELKKEMEKEINPFNIAGKLALGVEVLDGGMSFGVTGHYLFLDQFNPSNVTKEIYKKNSTTINLGVGQIDANLFVTINIAKLLED